MTGAVKRVLIADDEVAFLLSLLDGLQSYAGSFGVITATNGAQALGIIESTPIDLLVTDLKMPGADGFSLLARTRERWPEARCLVLTAFGSEDTAMRLRELDVLRCLHKPVDIDELADAILEALNSPPIGSAADLRVAVA